MSAIIPQPRVPITIRPAVMEDVPFIDALQKKHSKQVGWFSTKTIEGKIARGQVIIAEERHEGTEAQRHEVADAVPFVPACLSASVPLGYLIGADQYFKRGDTGIIYQINVVEGSQRALVGVALLKAQFERSAYGCRLYCCWCAQDIEANRFWEACGFVPIAFRAGSEKKQRVHIFWEKRIREGDTSTQWWYPWETKGGSMAADRLVLPIPPGTHWSDAKPIVLPRHTQQSETRMLEDATARVTRKKKVVERKTIKPQPLCGGLMFQLPVAKEAPPKGEEKPKRAKAPKIKNDPQYVAAARELCDRWMEKVHAEPWLLEASCARYEVCRALPEMQPQLALPAA